MSTNKFTEGLNSQQREAVEHLNGALLILAGPGSGKTRVLVHRIANLMREGGIFPSQILAVTFTNKAAREMKARIEHLVGASARDIAMGTFHSICLKILRRHADALGYSDKFVIYDESDQIVLVKDCMRLLNLDISKIAPNSVLDKISRAKDACIGPDEYKTKALENFYLKKISEVYELYQKRLAESNVVDFGDLIMLTVKLFRERRNILEAYTNRWRYVLVDEYQDTNRAQYELIDLLARPSGNICVVGDDDQSIYSWRGADISNILNFERDYSGCHTIRLEKNYRSTELIISAASAVVKKNAGRKGKEIWTDRGRGEPISIMSCVSERHEAERVAESILKLKRIGMSASDVAIFYRTNAQSRPFEDVFRSKGIRYRIYGGLKFYERAEVKDVLAYLRLLMEPNDDVGFLRAVNRPPRGIGRVTIEKLKQFAACRGVGMYPAIDSFIKSGGARGKAISSLKAFMEMMENIMAGLDDMPLGNIVREVLDKSGYVEALASSSSIESESKLENINELASAMDEFVSSEDEHPLQQFLDQVALVSEADKINDDDGYVTLMTAHLAKGLEFPAVFMVGMEEGLFPHVRSIDDPEALEEERRLCYVGMTRAKTRLFMSHAFRRRLFGSEKYNVQSRFLDEIPNDVAVRESFMEKAMMPTPIRRTNPSFDDDFDQRSDDERGGLYFKGMNVKHPKFGVGVIRNCEVTGVGHKVTVAFRDFGIRKLMAEFAGLVQI